MGIDKKIVEPSYIKENGIWVLDFENIQLPENFESKELTLVYLPPKAVGGNHKHPRTEIFLGIGDLELIWMNEHEELEREMMNVNDELVIYTIPSMTRHAVQNTSADKFGILIEYASGKQENVEEVELV